MIVVNVDEVKSFVLKIMYIIMLRENIILFINLDNFYVIFVVFVCVVV